MNNRLFIYGILPIPYGGVSVHLKRFKKYLEDSKKDFVFLQSNTLHKKKIFCRLFFSQINFQKNIIHLHGFQAGKHLPFILFLIVFFKKKVIITIHNDRFLLEYNSLNNIQKIITRIFYFNISHIISVNPDSKFGFIPDNKISIIPAFIPPTPDEINIKGLPDFFNKIKQKHNFLITANASNISFYNNQDLYGIDFSIELMKKLLNNIYKNIGFIFVIANVRDYNYFEEMQNLVDKYNLKNNFYFYTKPISYPAVINMCDLFIRPTNTDGDALSVREAIWLRKPTIASDVSKRPKGTIIFKNRSIEDLYIKIIDVINNYDEYRTKINNIEFEDNAKKILEVYKKVLNGE